jgi:hypothetical protein
MKFNTDHLRTKAYGSKEAYLPASQSATVLVQHHCPEV